MMLGRRRRRRRPRFGGPPVLMLHAGGLDRRMWQPLVERLQDRFWLIVPDLRGHGSTPLPAEPFSHVDDVLRLLDDLEVQRTAVVGASFGGWIALQLVTAAPERVSALALMASALDIEDWSPEIQAFWAQEDELIEAGNVDGAVALNVRTWVREPTTSDLVAEMARTAFDHQIGVEAPERELPVDLASIAVPTLAVSGGRDFPDFARIADRIAAEVAGAQRAEIADAGHLIALERPDATAELLRPFLEQVSA